MAGKLTPKQKTFCEEYLLDLNATQAAIRAGYSKDTAYSQGQRLLKNVEIQEIIQAGADKRTQRTEITADRVLQELALLAFSNMGDYAGGGKMEDLANLTRDQFAAIAGLDIDAQGNTKLKISDKGINLERLGRHLKLFTDKTEHSGEFNVTINGKDAGSL